MVVMEDCIWFIAEKYNAYTECNWKGFDEKWAHHKHLFQN